MTPEEYKQLASKQRIGRHGNVISERGDSRLETRRRRDLEIMQERGEITDLEIQPRIPLVVRGQVVCHYRLDARYIENNRAFVEDSKGHRDKTYALKAKLFMALYPGIVFAEYRANEGRVIKTVTKGGQLKDVAA